MIEFIYVLSPILIWKASNLSFIQTQFKIGGNLRLHPNLSISKFHYISLKSLFIIYGQTKKRKT